MTDNTSRVTPKQYIRLLGKYLRPLKAWMAGLAVLVLASIALQLALPQLMRAFIDSVQAGGTLDALLRLALIYLAAALAQQFVSLGAEYLGENVGWSATNALRSDLADHTLRLDLSFHNAHTPGEMIERIDGDVTALSNFFSRFTLHVLGNALLMVGIVVMLFRVDWRIGLTMAVFAAAVVYLLVRFRDIAVPHWKAERQANAELFGFLEERLSGTEDIRANGGSAYVLGRFQSLMRGVLRRSLKAALMINILLNTTLVLFALGNAAAFAVGAYLYQGAVISLGTVYIIFQYTVMLQRPIEQLTRQMQELQRAGAAVLRAGELFAVQSLLTTPAGDTSPAAADRSVCAGPTAVAFDHVTFSYPDAPARRLTASAAETADGEETALSIGAPIADATGPQSVEAAPLEPDPVEPGLLPGEIVLHDLSFTLPAGTVLGLLGRTGSGKTSITRLLFRFYDPNQGTVRICSSGDAAVDDSEDWIDLRRLPPEEVRRRVGMIPQHVQLFNASVRDNLTFFDTSIPDERIHDAIQALGLDAWLEALPAGLDSVLESGGGGLSAGQAQLLAFARIFLKDPGLVILDEASSRLDPATERLIEAAIDKLVRGRTAIIVAHRLGTVQRADLIMILEAGRVIEFGERQALAVQPESHFHRLLQTGLEEVLA